MQPPVLGNVNLDFINGLVFGFDVGTGSIGYAVRRGREFLDVGVIICPEKTSDLSGRRGRRRQRRTLRSKKYRRQWLAKELATILGLKLHDQTNLPETAWQKNGKGGWVPKPGFESLLDPVALRVRAIFDGHDRPLKPEELHAAIAHLWRRRGYVKVPWANREDNDDQKKETGEIKESISKLREEMTAAGCALPCQFLAKHPDNQRRRVWPRDWLKDEFDAIAKHHPKLAEKADRLLYGEKKQVVKHEHVFFKRTDAPGIVSLRWPRFDNRGPALDAWQPMDEAGRPLHVVRKNKEAFKKEQWELALMNFRVLDAPTRQNRDPRTDFPEFVASLRKQWDKTGKVTEARLKTLAAPFASKFLLIPDQKPLTPDGGAGRAKYSSETLDSLREAINAGERVDPPQPVLQRRGESPDRALDRYLADIKHPLVRHRLVLLRRLLNQLIKDHGAPDLIIVEAVRSLALSQKNKNELNKRNEQFRKEREDARKKLMDAGQSVSGNAIQKYRLWQEAKGRCPFCLQAITQAGLLNGEADIEHLVPRARLDCNEIYNLTIGHIHCNRNVKGDRTPHEAFCHSVKPTWEDLKANAAECFRGKKLEIFLSPNAEELIEQKSELVQTSYIAKVLRHLCLIRLGWLGDDGRDPTNIAATPSQRFQVTNGQLTSRLRQSWGLNHALYPEPPEGDEAAWKQYTEKNRGDLRHHALDAMVISSTLPWLAHRTHGAKDEFGNFGWWTQDEKRRSKAANPIGLDYAKVKAEIEKVVVRHHVTKGNHRKFFDTTLYGKRGHDLYIARKPLSKMKPKQLHKVYPETLADYIVAAWALFEQENPDIDTLIKEENRGKEVQEKVSLPIKFTSRLCFSHYQRWAVKQMSANLPQFSWPSEVKKPIKSVSVVADDGDSAMFETRKGSQTFVSQTEFKEIRVFVHPNGKKFVAEYVRPWARDGRDVYERVPERSKFVCRLRKGDDFLIRRSLPAKKIDAETRWILKKTFSTGCVSILPAHLSHNKEVLESLGFDTINFVRISLNDLMFALGYELPHPSSAQSESAGAAEA